MQFYEFLCLMSDMMKKYHFNCDKGYGKSYILVKQFLTFSVNFYICYLIYDLSEIQFKLHLCLCYLFFA